MTQIEFIICLVASFTISTILTPLVRNFFISHNWVEDPLLKHTKTQNATALKPVPRGGGLPIFISVTLVSLIFLPIDKTLLAIIAASFLTLIVGLFDDVLDISPKLRLFTNFIAAATVVFFGVGIHYVSNPFGGVIQLSYFSELIAILWIVWCMNITGWSAGIEGQLPGFVSISAIIIGILGLRFSQDIAQWPVIILAAAVAGAYFGFFPYNFFPQSIMPGYSGKSLAGFYLAILSILSGAKVATLILLLGIPMLDAIWAIIRRLRLKKPIYLGDGQHLHHQLLKSGWSRRKIAIFYTSISLFFGVLSLFLNSTQKIYALIGIIVLFFGLVLKFYRRI